MNYNSGLSLSHKTHIKITAQLDNHNINKELNWNFLNLCPEAWIKHEVVFVRKFERRRMSLQLCTSSLGWLICSQHPLSWSHQPCACPSFHYVCLTKSVASNGAARAWFNVNTDLSYSAHNASHLISTTSSSLSKKWQRSTCQYYQIIYKIILFQLIALYFHVNWW